MRQVKEGERFVPIEKQGSICWNYKTRRFEKRWTKSPTAYTQTGNLAGVDENGNDGLFAVGDWAIVERSPPSRTPGRNSTVSDLLAKFAR
jgi:hypothetical protein